MTASIAFFNKKNSLLFLLSSGLYIVIAYFIERSNSVSLLSAYALLFLFYGIIFTSCTIDEVKYWLIASVLLRICLLFAVPTLSDDFYRFIWDGRLLQAGIHPFSEVPSYYMQPTHNVSDLDVSIFQKLNSKEYFTIYPPVAQAIFWLCAAITPHSISESLITLKILILLAEVGSLFFLLNLLRQFRLPVKNVLLYALNPLVILELIGNVHFEAFMIFFLLGCVYFLILHKNLLAAIFFAFAVCVKLIPLIFLPVLFAVLGWRKTLSFYLIVTVTCILLFSPLLTSEIVIGFRESIGYYFQKFEFNASLYYLIREWGFWKYGYNIVQTAGWKLGLLSGTVILLYSWRNIRNRNLPAIRSVLLSDWLILLFIYLLFTTTVHPWYCTPLVAFCVFTTYRFPIVWSLLIFLTYTGYTTTGYIENLWIVAFEYCVVFVFFMVELWKRKSLVSLPS